MIASTRASLVVAVSLALASALGCSFSHSSESFFGGLGDLARKHGVSDWESEPTTWEAIGRGLARSDLADAERMAYAQAWTGGEAGKTDALDRGLTAAR